MKQRVFLFAIFLAFTGIGRAQDDQPPMYNAGWFLATNTPVIFESASGGGGATTNPPFPSGVYPFAENITNAYDINNMAGGLKNDPKRIFDFVHDHIRYVHYFGSHKGANVTLLERCGNDFDQCSLLVALLRSAGYTNVNYQFGMVSFPYSATNQQDYMHWVGATVPNTNWATTTNVVAYLNSQRGFPFTTVFTGDTNDVAFHHVWVTVTVNGTNYTLDPSFKVSEPIPGLTNLDAAMGLNASNLLYAAGGTEGSDYVQGVSESAVRAELQGWNSNLLGYVQSNYPSASVQQIIGGQQIVSSSPYALGQLPLAFTVQTNAGAWPLSTWQYIPSTLMAILQIGIVGQPDTNNARTVTYFLPALGGGPLTLNFGSDWQGTLSTPNTDYYDAYYGAFLGTDPAYFDLASNNATLNLFISIQHPYGGSWNFAGGGNALIRTNFADQSVTNLYQPTNAQYILLYAFDPDPAWLAEEQRTVNSYPSTGTALYEMGMSWLVQTEKVVQILAGQNGALPQFHHRLGRVAQETGRGYYVDVYAQLGGTVSTSGNTTAGLAAQSQVFQAGAYLASAMEHGVIQQMQNSNLVAASTVKMLEIANAQSERIYLVGSSNWLDFVANSTNYDTDQIYADWIGYNYELFLPTNGLIPITGAGSWTGAGYVAFRYLSSDDQVSDMIIGGGYNGGYVSGSSDTVNPPFQWFTDVNTPGFFNLQPPLATLQTGTAADPVNVVNGTFQVTSTDLSLGETEPRGLNWTRYYDSVRWNENLCGLGNGWVHSYYGNAVQIAAPLPGLGSTTPQQMAPMIVAARAVLNVYNGSQPDPKDWLVTALIAKWEIDQLLTNGVSINLGKDTIQFIQQPDGSYTPPANCTMSLTGSNGAYVLRERRGRTFTFDSQNRLSTIADPYGRTMTLTYNSSNLLSEVADWTNRTLVFTYSGSPPQLTSVVDSMARWVYYGYTGADLTSYTDPVGDTCNYVYDGNNRIIATLDANSSLVVTNMYGPLRQITNQYTLGQTNRTWQIYWSPWQTAIVDPLGGEQDYIFDDKSRQVGFEDALGNFTQTLYDGQDHVVTNISPLGEMSQFIYDGNNNLVETIDPLGSSNVFTFDSTNNLIASTDGNGNASHFGYNTNFSLTAQTNGAGDWVTSAYNTDGTLASRTDSGGSTDYGYDTYGQVKSISYPGSLGSEGFLNSAAGDLLQHTNGRGFITTNWYNGRRQLSTIWAVTNPPALLDYDPNANLLANRDPRGNYTTYYWSPTRHMTGVSFAPLTQGTSVVSNFYDTLDCLISSRNPLTNTTYYSNNAARQLVAVADPLLRTNTFAYDADGHTTSSLDAASQRTTQMWNARGNLVKVLDAASNIVGRTYDGAGNLIFLTNRNTNVWQFQYDGANRVTNTVSPSGKSTVRAYNDQGLLDSIRDPMWQYTYFYYDAKGRLSSRSDGVGTVGYVYDADDNVTFNYQGAQEFTWAYDGLDRPAYCINPWGMAFVYSYDANGNLTNLTYPGTNLSVPGGTVKYY